MPGAGPDARRELEIKGLQEDKIGLLQHVQRLEDELKALKSEDEKQTAVLHGRTAAAESNASRLEIENDSLASELADMQVWSVFLHAAGTELSTVR